MKHTIRTSANGRIDVDLTQALAIKLKCMDCLGYEGNPNKDCTSQLCPLYPFRGKTLLSQDGYTPRVLTDEQKAQASERFANYRKNKTTLAE